MTVAQKDFSGPFTIKQKLLRVDLEWLQKVPLIVVKRNKPRTSLFFRICFPYNSKARLRTSSKGILLPWLSLLLLRGPAGLIELGFAGAPLFRNSAQGERGSAADPLRARPGLARWVGADRKQHPPTHPHPERRPWERCCSAEPRAGGEAGGTREPGTRAREKGRELKLPC